MSQSKEDVLNFLTKREGKARVFRESSEGTEEIAGDIAALANAEGGVICLGLDGKGFGAGLSPEELERARELLAEATAREGLRGLELSMEELPLAEGRRALALSVPEGLDKPYFNAEGQILVWGRGGRHPASREELRLFSECAERRLGERRSAGAGLERLGRGRLGSFLLRSEGRGLPKSQDELRELLNARGLAYGPWLSVAGALLFGDRPERLLPQFVLKSARWPGTELFGPGMADFRVFDGPLDKIPREALDLLGRDALRRREERGAPQAEIPVQVFEETLVNALAHREYGVDACIRLFILDDRVELLSPGRLRGGLSVEDVKAGKTSVRNPVLVSCLAGSGLPWHGRGQGLRRALELWPWIDPENDREGPLFTVRIWRR